MHFYYLAIGTLSITGIFYFEAYAPILIHIFVIHFNETLKRILSALTKNYSSLGIVFALVIVCIYLFTLIGAAFFRDDMTRAEGLWCEDMQQCLVTSTVRGFTQGGGIGDVMTTSTNEIGDVYVRYLFHIIFFVVINLLGLNLIL